MPPRRRNQKSKEKREGKRRVTNWLGGDYKLQTTSSYTKVG